MSSESPQAFAAQAVSQGKERILVIDDEVNLRSTLEEFLRLSDFEVRTAASAEEALDLLGREEHDLVLADLKMPGVDGIAVIEWLREAQPEVPVVVMSAHATVESVLHALRLGAFDYLRKPFSLDDIHRTVGHCLERRRRQRRNAGLDPTKVRLSEIELLKENLLATVSHEFRTPLTTMRGYLDLLETQGGDNLRPYQRQAFEAIRASVERLDLMIGNLLLLTECQDSGYRPILQPVPVGEFVREVARHESRTPGRGVFSLDVDEAVVATCALLDAERFPLVLRNLLDNALKFRHEEKPAHVMVQVRRVGSQVMLEVHDDGIGIEEVLDEQLFERFTQGDMTATRRHTGAGLGLAVVREIVGAHGGSVHLVPPVLGGASVRILLPALPEGEGR